MIHQASARTTITTATANAVLCAFRPGIRPADLIELRLFLRNTPAVTASPTAGFAIGLTNSTTLGTGALTQVVGRSRRGAGGAEAGVGSIVTAWATASPVINTTYWDRAIGGTQIGYPVVFPFDRIAPYVAPDSSDATAEVCIALTEAHGTAPIFDIIAVWDE